MMQPFEHGHTAWAYRDHDQFLTTATEFLLRGLDGGELAVFVGDGDVPAGIQAVPPAEFYPMSAGWVLDPDAAIAGLGEAAGRAMEQGYTGLRIVGDATPLVRRATGREAFARYEFLADRVIAELPITALCAFDATALDAAAAELVCLHGEAAGAVPGAPPDFRLHAAAGAAFALDGEIDSRSADLFASTLDRVWPLLDRGDVVIDAGGLGYLDHNALLRLDAAAARGGRRIVFRGAGRLVCRLVDLIRPPNTVIGSTA